MHKSTRRGASGLAYGLAVGLISIVALGSVTSIGNNVDVLMTDVATKLNDPAAGAGASASAEVSVNPDCTGSCYASCADATAVGGSGNYTVDLDGQGGEAPFEVSCDGDYYLLMLDPSGDGVWVGSYNASPHMGDSCSPTLVSQYTQLSSTPSYDLTWGGSVTPSSSFTITWGNPANGNAPFTAGQLDALRASISEISPDNPQVAMSCDDDADDAPPAALNHEVIVSTGSTTRSMIPGTSNNASALVYSYSGGSVTVAGSGEAAAPEGPATALPPSLLIPEQVTLQQMRGDCCYGGGMAWGFDGQLIKVR